MTVPSSKAERYIGISLGGSRSEKTSLTIIDYYPNQHKSFVIDVYESISAHDEFSSDEVLLEIIKEQAGKAAVLAVDVPLTLPPCFSGCLKDCKGYFSCKKPEVKWMNKQFMLAKNKNSKLKHFTSYSQRPVDLYYKYLYSDLDLFQDETMGANLAPQVARMQYLKNHLPKKINLIEVWPKLALFKAARSLDLSENSALAYKSLDEGGHIREEFLEEIMLHSHLFIYERDLKKLLQNIPAFDSFVCAWVALLSGQGRTHRPKKELPLKSGWIELPK